MQVDDPAGGADEDVCACLERVYLPCRVDAPHDAADAAIQAFGDGAADSFDLLGKFPGGGEDEKAEPFLGVRGRLERVHQGKGEGERLSRPGLRAGDDVASLDRFRDGLFLYGRGLGEAQFRDGFQGPVGKVQPCEVRHMVIILLRYSYRREVYQRQGAEPVRARPSSGGLKRKAESLKKGACKCFSGM